MSQSGKMISWIVVAIIVIAGIWYFAKGGSSAPVPATNTEPSGSASTTSQGGQSAVAAVLSTKDSTDASLTTDLSTLDNQLGALGNDAAAVDKDLSDTPVPQE